MLYIPPHKGASVARNFALQYVTGSHITYLDDDDYLTPGYIKEMARHATSGIDLVCGRLIDYHPDSKAFDNDTYMNKVLKAIGEKLSNSPLEISSLLSTMWAKLYTKKFLLSCSILDEDLAHTEDIDFWINNFQHITSPLIYVTQ